MGINIALLQEQLDAAGIPNEGCNSAGVVYFLPEATQSQRDQAAAIVAAHNESGLSIRQKGAARLQDVIANNQDKLKYADYFLSRLAALEGLWQATTPVNITARFNSTVTIMQGNRASDTDHMSMWRVFLAELETDFNIVRTGDELPALTAAQQRQVMIGAKTFITMGAFTAMILLRG